MQIENVKTVGDGINIRYNDTLSSINGLRGLETLIGNLTITGNGNLPDCAIENVLKEIGDDVRGVTVVENNNSEVICE